MLQKFDQRNRDLIVNVGGRLSHRDEAGCHRSTRWCKAGTRSGRGCG